METKTAVQYQERELILPKMQRSIFDLLSNGNKYSSHQIMRHIHTSDPRKAVQILRRKGVKILDIWVDATPTYPRHKLYFIDTNEC